MGITKDIILDANDIGIIAGMNNKRDLVSIWKGNESDWIVKEKEITTGKWTSMDRKKCRFRTARK